MDTAALEKRLWDAAEQAGPAPHDAVAEHLGARPEGLLGLIFLRFAEVRFAARRGSYYDDPHDAIGRFDFVLLATCAHAHCSVHGIGAAHGRTCLQGKTTNLKDRVGPASRFPFGLLCT